MSATEASPAPATPKHLWIVGIVSLLWNAVGAFDYLMTQTRNESYMSQFTPEQLEFFYGFPTWVESAWAIAVWGAVVGSVLLLLRVRWAGLAFVISLVAMIATTIHNYGISNGMEIMGGVGPLIFSIVIFVVGVLLVVYSRWMCNRGVLR
jgi:hypothetical protein